MAYRIFLLYHIVLIFQPSFFKKKEGKEFSIEKKGCLNNFTFALNWSIMVVGIIIKLCALSPRPLRERVRVRGNANGIASLEQVQDRLWVLFVEAGI